MKAVRVGNLEFDGYVHRAGRVSSRRNELSGRPPFPITVKRTFVIEVRMYGQKLLQRRLTGSYFCLPPYDMRYALSLKSCDRPKA